MFSIQQKTENSFEKIILQDNSNGTVAEIIPACSAMLHAFIVLKNGKPFNVIESYESLADFQQNVKEKGFRGCKLSPYVCRVENGVYHFGEKDYQLQKSKPAQHALHGELYDRAFKITEQSATDQSATVSLKYLYDREDPGYPFRYECAVTWTLSPDNRLTATTVCTNLDEGLIPLQDGWHPYFKLSDSIDVLQLEFQSMERLVFDDELLPTGEMQEYDTFNSLKPLSDTVFDNCFTLNHDTCQPMCVLRNSEENLQVEFHPDRSYPYLQIYTPEHRQSIAIENLSGAPNGFNNNIGVKTLEAGQAATFRCMYKITLLKQ